VFCVDLRANSDYSPLQYLLTGFHNRDGVSLLQGTDWIFNIIGTLKPSGDYMYHKFNIQQFYVLLTQRKFVFCKDLRTNSDYSPIRHLQTGFYSRGGVCLLRSMDWIFDIICTLKPSGCFMYRQV